MQLEAIPHELTKLIGGDKTDFIAKVDTDKPLAESIFMFIGGLFLLLFSGSFLYHSFIILNLNIITDANNIKNAGVIFQYINLLFFIIISILGLAMIYSEIKTLIRGGGFFAGTEKSLIHYTNGKFVVKYWKEFTGKVEIKGNMNKGNIILELKTGSRLNRRNKKVFVHHKQMIIGVINYYEIGEKCQKRINEKLGTNESIIVIQ